LLTLFAYNYMDSSWFKVNSSSMWVSLYYN